MLVKRILDDKTVKTTLALSGGRIFYMMVSFILLLFQSRLIGPETVGKVAYFAIPLGYLWILTLGVPSALARELPYYIARGEKEKAFKYAQTAQSFTVVMGLLCCTVFAGLSLMALVKGNYFSAMGWAFQIVSGFFVIYNSYILTLYRTTDEFIKIAKSNTISALTQIAAFPIIFFNPILSLFIRPTLSSLTTNYFLYIKRPLKIKFSFDFDYFMKLFRFGIPLIAVGYIESNLWTSLQSSLIVYMGSTTWLGMYTFINQILALLLVIPHAIADILRPKLAMVYGETNGNIRKTLRSAFKPLSMAFVFSLIAVVISWLYIGDLINLLLPKYSGAIPALRMAIFVVPVLTIKCIKYIFVVEKNMLHNSLSTVSGFIVGIALLYCFLKYGVNFRYVFFPYLAGQCVNLLISFLFLNKSVHQKGSSNE